MELMLGYTEIPVFPQYRNETMAKIANKYLNSILKDKGTRKIFWFLCLNLSFTIVEFVYGSITNSLGLTADAIHMLFDCIAIIFSLIASVISSWPATSSWTFGFTRVETMAGFVNALALFFASGNILFEALERLWEPVELKTGKLLVVSVLGLLVNIGKNDF